jgi:hypothetical protein
MTRREWLILFVSAAGCRRPAPPPEDLLPTALRGGWERVEAVALPAEAAPELVRELGLRRAIRAVYRSRAELQVHVYEMTTTAAAFELLQKWRPAENTVYFHYLEYFVVTESDEVDREGLLEFSGFLEHALKTA